MLYSSILDALVFKNSYKFSSQMETVYVTVRGMKRRFSANFVGGKLHKIFKLHKQNRWGNP